MPVVRPIHVYEHEVVDIHWHTKTEVFVERRTCPPKLTQEARKPEAANKTPKEPTEAGQDAPGTANGTGRDA